MMCCVHRQVLARFVVALLVGPVTLAPARVLAAQQSEGVSEIALRASAGSADPAGILPTTLFATIVSTTVAVIATKFYQRFSAAAGPAPGTTPAREEEETEIAEELPVVPPGAATEAYPGWVSALAFGAVAALELLVHGLRLALADAKRRGIEMQQALPHWCI